MRRWILIIFLTVLLKMANNIVIKGDVALQVVDKYRHDPFERFRLLYDMNLRPFQWEWFFLLKENPMALGYASPRIGKTVGFEFTDLDDEVLNAKDECLIFAPKLEQAANSFRYQYDTVMRSEFLRALVRRNAAGKLEISKNGMELINGSRVKCIGILSDFEGENGSIIRVEELDDIPDDRLKRALGRGLATNSNGLPTRYRFTGVIWGKLNIWKYSEDENYFTLPPMDVYDAIAAGYIGKKEAQILRAQMSDDEWLRTMCCMFVESRNFIWSSWLHNSQLIGLAWNLAPVPYMPDAIYQRGNDSVVAFGLDMGAQGTSDDASDYALEVVEGSVRSGARRWLNGLTLPPDSEPDTIIRQVVQFWEFYRPQLAFGDARDANLIAQINEELYSRGLVHFDWKRLGKNDKDGWSKWAAKGLMTPLHNSGPRKHEMYTSLRNAINNCVNVGKPEYVGTYFVFPQVDRDKANDPLRPSWGHLQKLMRELANLVAEPLPSGYYKIERYKKKINDAELGFSGTLNLGDDTTDALAMANFALDTKLGKPTRGFVRSDYVKGF